MLSLGISYQMHDSAAAIVRDGELVHAVAEERLSRIKHDGNFPVRAVKSCLDAAGAKPSDVDHLTLGWSASGVTYRHDLKNMALGRHPISGRNLLNSTRNFASMWHQRGGLNRFVTAFGVEPANVTLADHHFCHALSSYACSGFDEAAVLVIDGRGAFEATSVWRARGGAIDPVEVIEFPNSLGLLYAAITHHLGFVPYSDEWKVMGLAPYGERGVDLSDLIDLDAHGYRVRSRVLLGSGDGHLPVLERLLGPRRHPDEPILQLHKDIAWAAQDICETAMLKLARRAMELAGRRLCMAGGVALNSKANGRILRELAPDDLFVQPAAADDGVAIGAAFAPHVRAGELPRTRLRDAQLGPAYDDTYERVLGAYKIRYSKVEPETCGAQLLAEGRIVGWVQGRAEFGPRSLGGRSILADPRDPAMRDRVNAAVKFRESWRPFAPSMLAECAQRYLQCVRDSPFMILTDTVTDEARNQIAAAVHVDGTARPQTVERHVNPRYWQLIEEFRKRTGVGAVLNTSFNLQGEPIVCTPTDALRTFFSSGMDALILGDCLVTK